MTTEGPAWCNAGNVSMSTVVFPTSLAALPVQVDTSCMGKGQYRGPAVERLFTPPRFFNPPMRKEAGHSGTFEQEGTTQCGCNFACAACELFQATTPRQFAASSYIAS